MKNISSISLLVLFVSLHYLAIAQPSFIYEGGDGGGYSMQSTMSGDYYLFDGGDGSGYSMQSDLSGDSYTFEGSSGSGYSSTKWVMVNNLYYLGGANDGYSSIQMDAQSNGFFEGGNGEGYVMEEKCEDFIWTGDIGTGWGVAGNWNYNIVPDLKRRAIIPAGVPSFPFVNAGIFAIGDNPNNGAFVCGELWIQEDALLVTRINNKVENYGYILVDGTMQVKNSSSDAFQNLGNGVVRISSSGLWLIKP